MSVRVFTKAAPCNKIDIWNTFRGRRGFITVPVTVAKGNQEEGTGIGEHVPGHLVRAGRAEYVTSKGEECIRLTEEGKAWLSKGTETYIRNQFKKGYKGVLQDVVSPMKAWREKYA